MHPDSHSRYARVSATYYDTLKRYPASINQWNHPWSSGDRHLDGLHLKVWFKVNGAIMGSRIRRGEAVDVEIKALFGQETGSRIVKAEIIGERGRVLHAVDHDEAQLAYRVTLPCEERYYFVKVYQEDGEFAATSPVWILD